MLECGRRRTVEQFGIFLRTEIERILGDDFEHGI